MRAAPRLAFLALSLSLGLVSTAQAQMRSGGWGGGWDGASRSERTVSRAGASREGQVSSAHFAAEEGTEALGHGTIRLVVLPDSTPEARSRLDYEAAVIDRLVLAGYDASGNPDKASQRAEIRISQTVAEPAEQQRSPISGSSSVMVSNRGTAYGMAVNVDMTKPRTALVSTAMDLRIRDEASGAVLWEARANILTREGDEQWDDAAIANRLAAALLEAFPHS
ncbi:MAG: hypothetical protein B7Y87_00740 [Sphingomonadales bacterium 32-64-22]|nr:MAG: hypothetical protein B7Y87_00740 [Sphingomonadales bacterium 32-64-22]